MVRREFPKGTNFNKISEKEIYGISKDHKQYRQEKFIIISLLMNYFLI
ncbi:hypothetical protein [Mycoplasmopsis cynos]|nr:hypothetical protein [Mycoplasmopsis cynos]UWV82978.1 hypothetical protein NW067_01580 [Mycoplasmopsis cynos]